MELDEIPIGVDMCQRNDMLNISMSSTMDLNKHLRKAAVILRRKAQHEAMGNNYTLHSTKAKIKVSAEGFLCLELDSNLIVY